MLRRVGCRVPECGCWQRRFESTGTGLHVLLQENLQVCLCFLSERACLQQRYPHLRPKWLLESTGAKFVGAWPSSINHLHVITTQRNHLSLTRRSSHARGPDGKRLAAQRDGVHRYVRNHRQNRLLRGDRCIFCTRGTRSKTRSNT